MGKASSANLAGKIWKWRCPGVYYEYGRWDSTELQTPQPERQLVYELDRDNPRHERVENHDRDPAMDRLTDAERLDWYDRNIGSLNEDEKSDYDGTPFASVDD